MAWAGKIRANARDGPSQAIADARAPRRRIYIAHEGDVFFCSIEARDRHDRLIFTFAQVEENGFYHASFYSGRVLPISCQVAAYTISCCDSAAIPADFDINFELMKSN